MHALITGGAGFIGSHLSEELLERGHTVSVIDDLSTGSLDNIRHLVGRPGFQYAIETIKNEQVLDRLAAQADVIFHLAAAVGVELIIRAPVRVMETNILGTETVLRTALRYRCKVLLASTSEIYGKSQSVPFREDHDQVLGPTFRSRWAYAASKAVDEFLALAYWREHGLPVVIFRLFNTVGPRQTGEYGMVVPRFVQAALRGKPIRVYGDGLQTRSFMHVRDAVEGILGLAEKPEAVGNVFNLGSSREITIQDLAHTVKTQIGSKSDVIFVPYEEAYAAGFEDTLRRLPDTSKIRALLGWIPKYSLEDILGDMIAYERSRMV